MTTVRGRIDQNIIRLDLQATFDDCLQIFVFCLEFLKGQVIHVNDESIVSILDLGNNLRQILKLMLIDLDHTKSLIVIFIYDRLDRC